MTAQDDFKVLVREHLGPALRQQRWKGTSAHWTRPHPTHWVLLNWQRTRHSNAEKVSFTANVKVLSKDAWDAENVPAGRRPDAPSASFGWPVGWEHRIGHLMPGSQGDHWWSLRPGDDLHLLADDVLSALWTHALPAMEQELAAAVAQPRLCWHNVGGRNWFQACGRPADVSVQLRDRLYHRCPEHAGLLNPTT